MPDVLPTINNEPAQGIQATLDTVYLWNPDVANELIEQINVLLEELEEISGSIRPYSELEAPVKQYVPMFYGDGLYVAAEDIEELPAEPVLSDWILVATKATDLTAGDGIVIHDGIISVTQAISEGAAAGATAVQPEDLGTAAYAATTDFATASQGTKADTAVQPADLGTAAYASTTDFATSAQGAKADTALQPGSSVPQYSTMPVAGADNLGEIVQYVGVPASGYSTGYFYKCVNNDNVYTWENIDVQAEPSIGRFLSLWNCVTGLAETNPPQNPYAYRAGDYFLVGTVSSATPAVNYKPNGFSYVIGTASSTVESGEVYAGDCYFFDGTNWRLQSNTTRTVTFANIAGDIYDNESAAGALNAKQATLVSGTNIKTINGNSILGSGNLELSTFPTFPVGWPTTGTTKAFCDAVAADTTATKGKAYLDEVTLSDMPSGIGNAEIEVKIMDGTTAANKVIVLTLTSGSVAPYAWIYTYWNGGLSVSGWQPMGGMVQSVNSKTGAVVLDAKDVNALPQYSTLPAASSSNSGDIVQYTGETISEAEASATISQTTGSGLSDLTIDIETFEAKEHPTGIDSVDFEAISVVQPALSPLSDTNTGVTATITDPLALINKVCQYFGISGFDTIAINYEKPANTISLSVYYDDSWHSIGVIYAPEWYITLEDESTEESFNITVLAAQYTPGGASWEKDGEPVTLSEYGIAYSGVPSVGDVLTVNYEPFIPGRDHAYIYESVPEYSEPAATISQTVGSGLTNLSVDLDTFVATEQPTTSETVTFVAGEPTYTIEPNTYDGDIYVSITDVDAFLEQSADFLTQQGYSTDFEKFYLAIGVVDGLVNEVVVEYWYNGQPGPQAHPTPSDFLQNWGVYVDPRGQSSVWGWWLSNCVVSTAYPWTRNSQTVDLADYGITCSGTVNEGDAIAVVYTAPTVAGYKWTQTNVQPSSGSSGGEGIEWKTKVDLPSNVMYDSWGIKPVFKVDGGLPDGEYEVYYEIMASSTVSGGPLCPITSVIRFTVNNANQSYTGIGGPVIDGKFIPTANRKLYRQNSNSWDWIRKKDQDFYLSLTIDWYGYTDVHGYEPGREVPECFKFSAIKNVNTGEEYVASGEIYDPNGDYGYSYSGNIEFPNLVQEMNVPRYYEKREFPAGDSYVALSINGVYVRNGVLDGCTELYVSLTDGNDCFEARVSAAPNGYVYTVEKATGVFANTQIGADGSIPAVMFNIPSGTVVDTTATVSISGATNDGLGTGLYSYAPSSFTLLDKLEIGTGPNKANYVGKILQYDGATNGIYTNGYFYKANGTIVTVPESLQATVTSPVGEATVTIDLLNWMQAFSNTWGWSLNDIRNALINYSGSEYNVQFYIDDNVVTYMYVPWYGGISEQSVLQYVTVSYTGSQASGYVSINFNGIYTPTSKSVQNPSWDRVDVQPGGGGGGGSVPTLTWYLVSTAGNTLTIADTSSATLVKIYKNGLLLEPTADYSISGTTLTMVTALVVGDKITTEVF